MSSIAASFRRWPALIALLLSMTALSAHAETYRMDLIVFLDRYAPTEAGVAGQAADTGTAIDPGDAAALQAAGITVLPDAAFGLQTEWRRLQNSKRFEPLVHLSWTQRDPPSRDGPAIHVRWGQPGADGVFPVDGRVKLLIPERYLTLDTDLLYSSGGRSWRLDTRRRMRRDELHHLDSARLGILARVTKADGP
ncbi:CsiV family protein [Solimonas marina]|uniref:Peptidoglycan-binding protein, CsiV n=1 Tax=Solimonas marina TaxID=2714601 RepID=A0A970B5K7_9GAMM|nr:CsiV family protein [Solimonas marina]NKF21818.1 hypothetical protein [Solimonas marina]